LSLQKITAFLLLILSTIVLADSSLKKEFENPSQQFRPYVWWHWMNGFINAEQAKQDLDWFSKVGIGGVQVFEAGLGPRAPDDIRIDFGSADWQAAYENSLSHAQSLGLDVAVPTSAGWSATGGPWVKPENAMKKLVWSKQIVSGGKQVSLHLKRPPDSAGSYLDVGNHEQDALQFYRDIKVLAIPIDQRDDVEMILLDKGFDSESIIDGLFANGQPIAASNSGEVVMTFKQGNENQQVYGVTVGSPNATGFGSPPAPIIEIQVSDDGQYFKNFVTLDATDSPARVHCFQPQAARYWRLIWKKDPRPGFLEGMNQEAGAAPLPFGNTPAKYYVSEVQWHNRACVNAAPQKAGFDAADDYYALASDPLIKVSAKTDQVIDLSEYMNDSGELTWQAPVGQWLLIRLGYSLTGHKNGPAPAAATGLETDKFDPVATRQHLDAYFAMLFKNKPIPSSVNGLLSDSIESHEQNWTESFPAEFKALHGYDIEPWLPVLTGEMIDSAEASDKFLWDFRQTINILYNRYYATLDDFAREHQLEFYGEALEDRRPQLGNDLDMRESAHTPMAAFWYYPSDKQQKGTYLADLKGAASVANVYGQEKVALEAITSFGFPWAVPPSELKRVADHAMILGANQFIMHSSIHQWMGRNFTPGHSMMYLLGHYFNRNSTWSEMARAWTDYIARMQVVLRKGHFRAEVAYFMGEEAPLTMLYRDGMPDVPVGIDYDFVSAQGLRNLRVVDGKIFNAKGNSYDVMYLGGSSKYMSLPTVHRLAEMVSHGAFLIGEKPIASPSLSDDEISFSQAIDALWQEERVLNTADLVKGLNHLNVKPKWHFEGQGDLQVHARRDAQDSFMLRNTSSEALHGVLRFDTTYGCVEQWEALTGKVSVLEINNQHLGSELVISLPPFGSTVLVGSEAVCVKQPMRHFKPVDTDAWVLSFDKRFVDLKNLSLPKPAPWSEQESVDMKYYSGIGNYQTSFSHDKNERLTIQLSADHVGDMAEVFINQESIGYLWASPTIIEKSVVLNKGRNTLSINVANVWKNRLVGMVNGLNGYDGIPPLYLKDAPIKFAGIEGVTIKISQ
jgi:hypothetical protein